MSFLEIDDRRSEYYMPFLSRVVLISFFMMYLSSAIAQIDQDGLLRPTTIDGQQQINRDTSDLATDSQPLLRPVFSMRSVDIGSGDFLFLDTTLADYHIPEPVYGVGTVGMLGSSSGAGYSGVYTWHNDVGRQLGYDQYRYIWQRRMDDRVILTTRSIFDIQYQQSMRISGSELRSRFYRQFADRIFLNFEYQQSSDKTPQGSQENQWDHMDIKLYRDGDEHQSYAIYQSFGYDEKQAHLGGVSLGQSATGRSKLALGHHRLLKKDSVATMRWHVSIANESNVYSYDHALSSATREVLGVEDTTIASIDLATGLRSWRLHNELAWQKGIAEISGALGVSNLSLAHRADTTSWIQLDAALAYEIQLSDSSQVAARSQMAYGDSDVDVEVGIEYHSPLWRTALSYRHVSADQALRSVSFGAGSIDQFDVGNMGMILAEVSYRGLSVLDNLSGHLSIYQNAAVPGASGRPVRSADRITAASICFDKDWRIWRINGSTQASYQHISSDVILRPSLMLSGDLSLPFSLFRGRLGTTIGANYMLVSSFQVPAYSPLYGAFYRDRGERSGAIIILDPYVSFAIDDFRFYMKWTNPMTEILTHNQQWVQDYPLYTYRFAFGAAWRFMD